MAALYQRSNDALKVNPPVGDTFSLTVGGSDWLWAVTALYSFSLLIVICLAYFARSGEKILHYLFTISLFVGSVSYFTLASDLGSTPVETLTNQSGTRQIFYVKYINWFIGWTPLITAVGLISGVSWSTIIYNIALSWIWIATWLSGALVTSTYKWGFFVFGVFAYCLLSLSLFHTGLTTARRLSITKHYLGITSWLVFVWLLYPVAYGLDDGGNEIGVTEAFIFWGVLDIFTVPFLSFTILFLARGWDYRDLNLYFTQYGRIPPPIAAGEFAEGENKASTTVPGSQVVPPATSAQQTV